MFKSKLLTKSILTLFTVTAVISCRNNGPVTNFDNQISENVSEQGVTQKAKKYLVKITVKNKDLALELVANGIDLFGTGEGGRFDAYVNDKQINFMKSINVEFAPGNNALTARGGLPAGYHTAQQVMATVRGYAAKYPNITQIVDIGDSWEKTTGKAPENDIWALIVTNKNTNAQGGKKTAVFMSGIHARELAPVEINLRFMDYLLSNYGKDEKITQYIDSREIVFIPVENIDGRIAVEQGDTMWRKNRHIEGRTDGIDLNRNFDGHWNFQGVPSTPTLDSYRRELEDPQSEIYSGKAPFSEPETQAVDNFLRTRNLTIMMDLHSYGNMVIWPPGYTNAPIAGTPLFKKVGKVLTSKNGYRGGTSMELLYPTCGTTKDWAYDHHNAVAFTMEIGGDGDGFRPAFSRVEKMWTENKDGLLYLVSIADNPAQ
jgi:carboxypeptidase T